jgi:gluconate 2-dehydrogenase alpha chain
MILPLRRSDEGHAGRNEFRRACPDPSFQDARFFLKRTKTLRHEPYHELREKLFGIAGKAGNLRGQIQAGGNPFEAPRQNEYPQPPLQTLEAGVIFDAAADKLGYKPFPMPAANSPKASTNPDGMELAQCQYCGHCERFLCEANAKASPQSLLYPWLARQKSFELRTGAHVNGIDYDKHSKKVIGVRYIDLESGEECIQPADIVVLAAFTMTNTKFADERHRQTL